MYTQSIGYGFLSPFILSLFTGLTDYMSYHAPNLPPGDCAHVQNSIVTAPVYKNDRPEPNVPALFWEL